MRYPIAALCLTFLLSACAMFSTKLPEQWEESNLNIMNQQVVFAGVVYALQKEGFPVGMGADAGLGQVVTGWRVQASPFKGKGFRERATLNFGPTEDSDGTLVRVRVERETNESFRPTVEGSAKWEQAPDQPAVSTRILQYAHSYLDQGTVDAPTARREEP